MNHATLSQPVTQHADDLQNAYWYGGNLVKVLVNGDQTDGRFAQLEFTVQPGTEPPAHTHTREDEAFYLLEGSMRFTIGEEVVTAHPGDFVQMPSHLRHSFKVLTPTAKFVMTVSPAGFENYFCHPLLSQPAPALVLPPAPQGPPPAAFLEQLHELLEGEFGIRM